MKWNNLSAYLQIKTLSAIAAAMLLGMSQSTWAAGTVSGTTINNLATLNYNVGGVAQPAVGSSPTGNSVGAGANTAFVVDNKVNLTVTTVDVAAVAVVPGQTTAVTPIVATFTVTNNGNTVQDYSLVGTNLTAGPTLFGTVTNFQSGACSAYVESGATAGYQAAQDTAIFVDELAPDTTKTVYVVCASIPSSQVNGDQAAVSLTATTATGGTSGSQGAAVAQTAGANTAGVDIVFADSSTTANANGTDPGQTARDAVGVARDAFKVVSANLSVTKTVTPICDPFNGNANQKNIPGAAIQYAITIANTGAASASLSTVADALASTLTFDPKLNSGALPATSCVSGNAANTLSASGFGAVTGSGTGPGVVAPGSAANATTAGAAISGQNITITFNALATSSITAPAAATLAPGSYITVYFNAFVQ